MVGGHERAHVGMGVGWKRQGGVGGPGGGGRECEEWGGYMAGVEGVAFRGSLTFQGGGGQLGQGGRRPAPSRGAKPETALGGSGGAGTPPVPSRTHPSRDPQPQTFPQRPPSAPGPPKDPPGMLQALPQPHRISPDPHPAPPATCGDSPHPQGSLVIAENPSSDHQGSPEPLGAPQAPTPTHLAAGGPGGGPRFPSVNLVAPDPSAELVRQPGVG